MRVDLLTVLPVDGLIDGWSSTPSVTDNGIRSRYASYHVAEGVGGLSEWWDCSLTCQHQQLSVVCSMHCELLWDAIPDVETLSDQGHIASYRDCSPAYTEQKRDSRFHTFGVHLSFPCITSSHVFGLITVY